MSLDVDLEKQNKALSALFPNGWIWSGILDKSTQLYGFCSAIAQGIIDFKTDVLQAYQEIFYSKHTSLTNDWRLTEYGLPNQCDLEGRTLELLENGIDTNKGLPQIVEDSLALMGIKCSVIDEIANNQVRRLSVFVDSSESFFADCIQTISCDMYTGSADCTDIMYVGSSANDTLRDISCILEKIIPLGWNADFYLDTYDTALDWDFRSSS